MHAADSSVFWDVYIFENNDLIVNNVEMLVDEPDADASRDIMPAQNLAELVEVLGVDLRYIGNV